VIDLHQHTTISDGSYSVEQTIELSKARGLKIISITDHDTLDSQYCALKRSKELGINYIYGIEISAIFKNKSVHVLGYFPNHPSIEFVQYVKNQRIMSTIKNMRIKSEEPLIGYYELKDVVELIHKNNGLAILAHPIIYHKLLDELLLFLDGAECINPSHDSEFAQLLINKCTRMGLFCTSGTDFHDNNMFVEYSELCEKHYKVIEPFVRIMCN
jgi:hypothetical protein